MATHRVARWSRTAAIAGIPMMGALLVVVIWSTLSSVRAATATSDRGEAAALHADVRAAIFGDPATELPLDARVRRARADRADTLAFLAIVADDGALVAADGTPSPPDLAAWIASARPGEPTRIGERLRVVFRRPPRPDRDPDRPPTGILMELVPRVSPELGRRARWLAVVGGIAALTLTVLAGVLVRWSLGRERAIRVVEQARRLATLGQVSAVLAHEIRNPLASLKGNAQLLAGGLPEGDRMRAKAARVVEEAVRLETLSNELLEFARDAELRRADHDPAALVRDAAEAAAPGRVAVDDAGAPRAWPLDADKLRRVLINVFENAVELGGDGAIEARVWRAERDLAIEVRDHGPGIDEADLPHVFEPFFTRRTRGTGLGLAVAKRLVDLHGGTITASNAPGGGASLRITLPRR